MKVLFATSTVAWVQSMAAAAYGVGEYAPSPEGIDFNGNNHDTEVTLHETGRPFTLSCDRHGAGYTVIDDEGSIVTFDETTGVFTFADDDPHGKVTKRTDENGNGVELDEATGIYTFFDANGDPVKRIDANGAELPHEDGGDDDDTGAETDAAAEPGPDGDDVTAKAE